MNEKRRIARIGLPTDDATQKPRKRSGVRPIQSEALVLVVDDDRLMREALRRMVERRYRAIEAPDAATALALCVKHRPSLVLSDFDMPAVTGKRLAELLAIALGDEAPPVVIVTGGDMARASGDGVARVLAKPVGLDPLLDALTAVLEETRASG